MIRIEYSFFAGRLSRRVFFLFLACAALPLLVTGVIAYQQISNQLREQSSDQLQQSSKFIGLEHYRRLTLLSDQLHAIRDLKISQENLELAPLLGSNSTFSDIWLTSRNGNNSLLLGEAFLIPEIAQTDHAKINEGKTAILLRNVESQSPEFFMALQLVPGEPDQGMLVGKLVQNSLWPANELLPSFTELTVLLVDGTILYNSSSEDSIDELVSAVIHQLDTAERGEFNWSDSEEIFQASFWSVFSEFNFTLSRFVVVVSQPQNVVLAPLARFESRFIPILLLVILIVSLFSVHQIHNKLAPLISLRDATQRIARGDFSVRLQVSSNDEIGQLEHAFNTMAQDLEHYVEARDNAQAASKAKSDFLSHMSHELRTPLNAIIGYAQLLDIKTSENQSNYSDAEVEYPKGIVDAGFHLLDLINEILDLARIEAGRLEVDCNPVALSSAITWCIKQVRVGMAETCSIKIDFLDNDSTLAVMADEKRVKQVMFNLLSNAVKYNREKGRVSVSCESSSDNQVRITVSDTGLGIPEDQMGNLFEPFERLGFQRKNIEGTGIGLTVTRQLVQAMGGEIGVSSEVGTGTSFWIELPRATDTPTENSQSIETKPQTISHIGCNSEQKVLYIEDNPVNVSLVREALKILSGFSFVSAETAEEGLKLVENEKPELILMDIGLPGMDGLSALKILKNDSDTKHIPVIALSASALESDIETGLESGFDAYLTKPVNIPELLRIVEKFGTRSALTD